MTAQRPLALALLVAAAPVLAAPPTAPVFDPTSRAVSTWRAEAAASLVLDADRKAALAGPGAPPSVARCIKLNNYWCIKKAGWAGELAADTEGHVAFASAVEGAAVAALLLKRYYVDFGRKSAMAIISRWAPAQCGLLAGGGMTPKRLAPKGLGNTLRARWLATHARGFVTPISGKAGKSARRSVVADRVSKMMPAPTIAVGLGEASKPTTLDALLMTSPNAPPSRSMLGLPRGRGTVKASGVSGCGSDGTRIAAYADKAAAGIAAKADGDLDLFTAEGAPTPNLATMMANMARVEIGPDGAAPALIEAGIAAAFKLGRNP